MTNLALMLVLGSWICTAAPGAAGSGDHDAVYAQGHAKLVEVMKIGGGPDEGDEPPPFYKPYHLCVGRDGVIYVLDYETMEISAFDRVGAFQFKFARSGEGPGELRFPEHMATDRFGRIVVHEGGNKRFSLFSARGKFIRTASFPDRVPSFEYLPDGRILAEVGRGYFSPPRMETVWNLVLLDSTFAVSASLDSLTEPLLSLSSRTRIVSANQPYRSALVWCASPDGRIYFARNGDYKISELDERLNPVRAISRTVPGVPISDGERERYLESVPPELKSRVQFPAEKPCIEGLYCDNYGYLLVIRATRPKEPALMDIYRPDGSFIGELTVPGLRRAPVIDGDTWLTQVFSKEELPAVIRYRLE